MARQASWFGKCFGFEESSPGDSAGFAETQKQLVDVWNQEANTVGDTQYGTWVFKTLEELREAALELLAINDSLRGQLKFTNIMGEAGSLHQTKPNCLFQVASQFNCLEFVSQNQTPLEGITIYQNDHTQGPACAMQCPAASAYRNYLVAVPWLGREVLPEGTGQAVRQLNSLDTLGLALGNWKEGYTPEIKDGSCRYAGKYWDIFNGYMDADREQLAQLNAKLKTPEMQERWEELKGKVRIGVHLGARVSMGGHLVSQAFCAAPSISYSKAYGSSYMGENEEQKSDWEPFARLLLEAQYEATLWATVLHQLGSHIPSPEPTAYLTAVGGGVFGNDPRWIADSINKALDRLEKENVAIKAHLVHYHYVEDAYRERMVHRPPKQPSAKLS